MTTPRPETVDCPHGADCGACSFLRVPYDEQLTRKRRRLADVLGERLKFGKRHILPTLPSPRIDGYRNRAKMTIAIVYVSMGLFSVPFALRYRTVWVPREPEPEPSSSQSISDGGLGDSTSAEATDATEWPITTKRKPMEYVASIAVSCQAKR